MQKGAGDIASGEVDAGGGHGVEVWCLNGLVAIDPEGIVTLLIGGDEEEIRTAGS